MSVDFDKLKASFPPERFMSNCYPEPMSGCWLWIGPVDGRGYAKFIYRHRAYIASRVSAMVHGMTLPLGKVVCHRCDNRLCVNPDHLFVGTQKQNMDDMRAKGRAAVGERMPTAKLTAAKVRGIRFLASLGRKQNVMAEQYGVSKMTISRVVNRQLWSHV